MPCLLGVHQVVAKKSLNVDFQIRLKGGRRRALKLKLFICKNPIHSVKKFESSVFSILPVNLYKLSIMEHRL